MLNHNYPLPLEMDGRKWRMKALFQYLESKEPHERLCVDAEHQNVAQEAVNV